MLVLVGLGNPGSEYQGNRHNIGFLAVEEIARAHGFGPWRKRFNGRTAEGNVAGDKVLALEPLTYMNLSGQSVAAALAFFKVELNRLVVIHDDIDLAPGKLKIKKGGGAGGHNGLRSIDQHLGPDYWRLRLGVGHPGHRDLVHNYVLHDFAKADLDWLAPLLQACATAFPLLVEGHPDRFSTKVALLTQPPKPKTPAPEPQ